MLFIFVWNIQNISQISYEYIYIISLQVNIAKGLTCPPCNHLLLSNKVDNYDGQLTRPELLRTVIQITCHFKNESEYTISLKISDNVNILLKTHFVRSGHS